MSGMVSFGIESGEVRMKIKDRIINAIGCIICKWTLENYIDGLVVHRKGGAVQRIKVFSDAAYRNIIKPSYTRTKDTIQVGDVIKGPYYGEVVVTSVRDNLIDGYYRADGIPVRSLPAEEFKKLVGHVDVKVGD